MVGETATRIYRLTAAGASALHSPRSVPDWYRCILELVQDDATSGQIVESLDRYPGTEVLKWIEQLETLGFLESLLMPRASNTAAFLGELF
jgi:hypothetical protein